ncbi:MAG: hypothetical protein PWP24_1628, partial [Clostridiales bacterium]|nr:hypothetical protein [Clostridiales bacterium]
YLDNATIQKIRFADANLDGVVKYDVQPLLKFAPMNAQSDLVYTTQNRNVAKYNNGTLQFTGQGETNAVVRVSGTDVSAVLPITVYKDLCLNKVVTVSSTNTTYRADYAVDTDTTVTRWQSNTNNQEWIQIDMGQAVSFDVVDIRWYSNGEAYNILTSNDGENWTSIKEVTGQASGAYVRYNFDEPITARYLKVQGISDSQYSIFSIRALQKYGSGEIEVEPWNLALGKIASCSTYDQNDKTKYNESYAIDGNESTRWASQRTDDQWYVVDLVQTASVSAVNILWEAAAGKEYKIQISDDGEIWTDMVHETSNTGAGWRKYNFSEKFSGRYVRMLGISRVGSYGYSIYELEVIGTDPSVNIVKEIKEISLSKNYLSVMKGQSASLYAITNPEVNSISVGWESSAPDIISVSEDGVITAMAASGAAIITAFSRFNKEIKAECMVSITPYQGMPVKVEAVKIKDISKDTFQVGKMYNLTAEILPENASNKNVTWSSSNPKVALVSAGGRMTAVAEGEVTITATSTASGLTDEVMLKIIKDEQEDPIRVESVKIKDISKDTFQVGKTYKFSAEVLPENASNKSIIWSSSNPNVALIDAEGRMTAVTAGKVTITVTSVASGVTDEVMLEIKDDQEQGGSTIPIPGDDKNETEGDTQEKPTKTHGGTVVLDKIDRVKTDIKENVLVSEGITGGFYDTNGRKVTNAIVKTKDEKYFILDENGEKYTDSMVEISNGTKYIAGSTGEVAKGTFVVVDGERYYTTKGTGKVVENKFFKVNGNKYKSDESGKVVCGSIVKANGDLYYTTRKTGKVVQNKVFKLAGKKYAALKSGKLAQSQWVKIEDGKKVYCDKNGVIVKTK